MARKKANYPLIESLEIVSVAAEGKALGRYNDVVVFVPMAVPGDVVDVQVRSKRRRFMEGLSLIHISGNTNNVNFVLSRCRIAEYFDAIANGDMISHGKPDPEVYLLAAKLLGLKPEECVVIEDAPVGIEAARRAGMAAVALATTFSRDRIPDYDILVDDFTQLGYEQVMHLPAFADRPVPVSYTHLCRSLQIKFRPKDSHSMTSC